MEQTESFKQQKADKGLSSDELQEKKWAIISLASIPLIMTLGNSMLIPVLPTLETKLNISAFQSSLIITVYSVVAIILIPIAGYLSDKFGRKVIIIPSLFIAAIGGLISGFASWKIADPYIFILIGRTLQGVGAAGAAPIVMPLVGDMFRRDKDVSTSLGLIETSNTLGKVLSPILGAFLAGIIWYMPFFAFPAFCALSILLIVFLVHNPKSKEEEKQTFKQFKENIKKVFSVNGHWLTAIFIIGVILMFVLFGVLFYLSSILETKYNIIDLEKGWVLALPLGALCLSSYITGKSIKENLILMKWLSLVGIVLLGLSMALLQFSDKLWYLLTVFLCGGIGIGMVLPCLDAMITEGINKSERGTITSIYSSMRFIGVAAGPPIIAIWMKGNTNTMFYFLAGLCLIASFLTLKVIKPDK